MNFVSKWDFFCLLWWEMFVTDTIVYPCELNQNRYENGLAPVNTGKFTFQKPETGLIGLRFRTCVNVALGEFRMSSYNTNFLSNTIFF